MRLYEYYSEKSRLNDIANQAKEAYDKAMEELKKLNEKAKAEKLFELPFGQLLDKIKEKYPSARAEAYLTTTIATAKSPTIRQIYNHAHDPRKNFDMYRHIKILLYTSQTEPPFFLFTPFDKEAKLANGELLTDHVETKEIQGFFFKATLDNTAIDNLVCDFQGNKSVENNSFLMSAIRVCIKDNERKTVVEKDTKFITNLINNTYSKREK